MNSKKMIKIGFRHCREQEDVSNCASHEETKAWWQSIGKSYYMGTTMIHSQVFFENQEEPL